MVVNNHIAPVKQVNTETRLLKLKKLVKRLRLQVEEVGSKQLSYIKYLTRRADAGNWFIVYNDYLLVMDRDEAWVLQLLLNTGKMRPKKSPIRRMWRKGWIHCTVGFLERRARMKKKVQQRVLASLQAKGFVELKFAGLRKMRFAKVGLLKVEEAVMEAKMAAKKAGKISVGRNAPHRNRVPKGPTEGVSGAECAPLVGRNRPLIKKEEGKKESAAGCAEPPLDEKLSDLSAPVEPPDEDDLSKPAPANKGTALVVYDPGDTKRRRFNDGPPVSQQCCDWWEELKVILKSRIPIVSVPPSPIKKQANEFRILLDSIGGDNEAVRRIDSVLKWYKSHINKLAKPIIQSAKQFRDRFFWLESVLRGLARASQPLDPESAWIQEEITDEDGKKVTVCRIKPGATLGKYDETNLGF